jgi:cytochrome c peroxidase
MNTTWNELIASLRDDAEYSKDFIVTYGSGPTRDNVLDALAAFQNSLVTPNAAFDRYLNGESDAISPDEKRGYELFKSYGCVACHQGTNFGGNLSQPFGIFDNPFNPSRDAGARYDRVGSLNAQGGGQLYRVPSLRNVAVTAPYFHNGYTSSLAAAVEIMGRSQLGRRLSRDDIHLIVRFLDTLTGEYEGRRLTDTGDVSK